MYRADQGQGLAGTSRGYYKKASICLLSGWQLNGSTSRYEPLCPCPSVHGHLITSEWWRNHTHSLGIKERTLSSEKDGPLQEGLKKREDEIRWTQCPLIGQSKQSSLTRSRVVVTVARRHSSCSHAMCIPAHTNPTTSRLNLESSALPNSLQSSFKKYRNPSYGSWLLSLCMHSHAREITHARNKLHHSSASGGYWDKTATCVLSLPTEWDSALIMAAIFHCRTTTTTLRGL